MELKQLIAGKFSAFLPYLKEVNTQNYSLFRNSQIHVDVKLISYHWSLSDEKFSDIFRGYRRRSVAWTGLTRTQCQKMMWNTYFEILHVPSAKFQIFWQSQRCLASISMWHWLARFSDFCMLAKILEYAFNKVFT